MRALWLSVLIVISDQWVKELVRGRFSLHETLPVIPGFFNMVYVRNTGAAWGMLGGMNLLLIAFSFVMLVLLVVFRKSFLSDTGAHRFALGCMAGGIVGNLLDRVRLGYVTDFLDFYIGPHHWPSFNIADSAICIGVGIYIITTTWAEWRRRGLRPAAAPRGDERG